MINIKRTKAFPPLESLRPFLLSFAGRSRENRIGKAHVCAIAMAAIKE